MDDEVRRCYDRMAASYHLIFDDWEASIARQAEAIGSLLEREAGGRSPLRILDCACGIGTQALGLAMRGYRLTGSDFSAAAVARARDEAARRGLDLSLYVADMCDLSAIPESGFDAVVCLDNALPHLQSEEDLLQAARQIRGKLRPGGLLLAGIRDYDSALQGERPVVQGPTFKSDNGRRRIVHQIWDWIDDRRYVFHLYITRETEEGWESEHFAATYRAVRRDELTAFLEAAGFAGIRWLDPAQSSRYQPVVLAKAGSATV